jgi:hypothetical protein
VELDDIVEPGLGEQASRTHRERLKRKLEQRRHQSVAEQLGQQVRREDERPDRDGLALAAAPWKARVPRARQINMAACSSHSEGELDRTHPATMSQGQGREGQDAEDPHVVWNDRRSAELEQP